LRVAGCEEGSSQLQVSGTRDWEHPKWKRTARLQRQIGGVRSFRLTGM